MAEAFFLEFALTPVIATEIEFYLPHAKQQFANEGDVLVHLRKLCEKHSIAVASIEKERGEHQYEIALPYSDNIKQVILNTETLRNLLITKMHADFSAKPYPDEPGSGLHVHVHLEDSNRTNVFTRNQEDEFSPHLLYAVGGLLKFINPCMIFFAPTEASYHRFISKSNAPTTVSWGTNNRTVALRLPTKPRDNKHIEHRVSGSDATIQLVVKAIFAGIHYGIKHRIQPDSPIYGDAALEQYSVPKLIADYTQAMRCSEQSAELKEYLPLIYSVPE